jgi:hypothetical protein
VLEAVFYSVGAVLVGTGVVLLITDRDGKEGGKEASGALKVRPRVNGSPQAGLTSAGLDLGMAF